MRFSRFFPLVFAVFMLGAVTLHAQTKSAEEFHNDGVAALRKADYAAARTAFEESLKQNPGNPSDLFNLGLVEYRSGKKGLGLGLWRKALAVAPGFNAPSHAIRWAEQSLPRVANNGEFSMWESFREHFLLTIPLSSYLFLVVMLLLLAGWLLLRYAGSRRRALLDERPLPPFPWVATLFVALWLLAIVVSAAKFYDLQVPRATVVEEKVPVRTSPDPEGTALFDLFEGHEVIVQESMNEWFQVTLPGGLTGWVPKDSVFISTTTRASR
jgi:tetratricopeptide (TPR) repeat protein